MERLLCWYICPQEHGTHAHTNYCTTGVENMHGVFVCARVYVCERGRQCLFTLFFAIHRIDSFHTWSEVSGVMDRLLLFLSLRQQHSRTALGSQKVMTPIHMRLFSYRCSLLQVLTHNLQANGRVLHQHPKYQPIQCNNELFKFQH